MLSRRHLLLGSLGLGAGVAATQFSALGAAPNAALVARVRWRGADVSFLPQLEGSGAVYRDAAGVPMDALALLRLRGVNLIRLRLWHTPVGGWCDLAHTIALAQRARQQGLAFMLDIHYSDTWADPGTQTPPAAWAGLSGAILRTAVRNYTRDTLLALAAANVWPAMVQLGNEITNGLLWPHGRISTAGWGAFAAIYNSARAGVDDAVIATGRVRPRVLLHIDRGGDNSASRWYYDNALAQGMAFDTIALSYYPWWHGSFTSCICNVADMRNRYGKDVMIAETAYPWTLGWNDNQNNIVGLTSQLLPGFPATPGGQKLFVQSLETDLMECGAAGWCYWAPEWTAAPNANPGSEWENLAWFGFDGRLL